MPIVQVNNRNKIETIILYVVLLELFVMGSGRLLEFGPLTLRMFLFIICMLMVCHNFFIGEKGFSESTLLLIGVFILMLSLSTLVGYINMSDPALIFEDIKPLLYFLMLLFFELTITDKQRIHFVSMLIRYLSVLLALIYLSVLLALYFGVLEFNFLYQLLSNSSDFMFRGEANDIGIFYKGFLYLCIGLLFHLFGSSKKSIFLILLLIVAILLTFTRGFIVAIIPVILLGYYLIRRNAIIAIALAVILGVLGGLFILNVSTILGNKLESDFVRIITAQQVVENITMKSFFVGHGFGQGVPERPVHMETSLLEIFHKQGLFGLSFWILILVTIIYYYRQSVINHNGMTALPFVLSTFFIYLQSITNPFMNNPIGMSFLLISIICLKLLAVNVDTYRL